MSLKPKFQQSCGFEQSDDSDLEEEKSNDMGSSTVVSQVTVKKATVVGETTSPTNVLKRSPKEDEFDEYDFVAHSKRARTQKTNSQRVPTVKPRLSDKAEGESRRSYAHKWGSDEEEETNSRASSSSNGSEMDSSSSLGHSRQVQRTTTTVKTDIRLVRQAKQCLDMGELKDFQNDLDYFMETLGSREASINLKCLSMVKLTKRSVTFEFRQYLRTKPAVFQKLLLYLKDCHENPALSICVATFFYMLARDSGQYPFKQTPILLLFELLKQDKNMIDADFKSYQAQCWEIIESWKKDCEKRRERPIVFDLTEKNFTPGYLALVTMDYVLARAPNKNKQSQTELLSIGFFPHLISKVDKTVLSLRMLRSPNEEILVQHLTELEHAFRICENGIMLEKKNQVFVVGHRNGIILFSSEKFLDYFCQEIPKYEVGSCLSKKLFGVLELMFRLMMNASHSNETCAIKLGQIGNFLSNSVLILGSIGPRFGERDRLIDFNLLILGLLINLTEKSAANRRKVCNVRLKSCRVENGEVVEEPEEQSALDFLTLLFVRHETMARTVDEELDNQLMEDGFEDEPNEQNVSDDEDTDRLNRPSQINEDEIINALNSAMTKATSHMQDSMMASYVGLLIGCLIQIDDSLAERVRAHLPNGNFKPIIEQLERFREFVEMTKIVDITCISNIIESLTVVSGQ